MRAVFLSVVSCIITASWSEYPIEHFNDSMNDSPPLKPGRIPEFIKKSSYLVWPNHENRKHKSQRRNNEVMYLPEENTAKLLDITKADELTSVINSKQTTLKQGSILASALWSQYVIPIWRGDLVPNDELISDIRSLVALDGQVFEEFYVHIWAIDHILNPKRTHRTNKDFSIFWIDRLLVNLGMDMRRLNESHPPEKEAIFRGTFFSEEQMPSIFRTAQHWGYNIRELAKLTANKYEISRKILNNEIPPFLDENLAFSPRDVYFTAYWKDSNPVQVYSQKPNSLSRHDWLEGKIQSQRPRAEIRYFNAESRAKWAANGGDERLFGSKNPESKEKKMKKNGNIHFVNWKVQNFTSTKSSTTYAQNMQFNAKSSSTAFTGSHANTIQPQFGQAPQLPQPTSSNDQIFYGTGRNFQQLGGVQNPSKVWTRIPTNTTGGSLPKHPLRPSQNRLSEGPNGLKRKPDQDHSSSKRPRIAPEASDNITHDFYTSPHSEVDTLDPDYSLVMNLLNARKVDRNFQEALDALLAEFQSKQ